MKDTAFDIVCLPVGQMAANCYLVSEKKTRETVIIDPGDDPEYIIDEVRKRSLIVTVVAATHGHFDHVMGAAAVHLAFDVPFLMNTDDEFLLATMAESIRHFLGKNIEAVPPQVSSPLSVGSEIVLGEQILRCLCVPGHTPGSIALAGSDNTFLLVGDTIFAGGAVGRTDFSYSDHSALLGSLQKILAFPPEVRLYPGHGESTTVSAERVFHARVGSS